LNANVSATVLRGGVPVLNLPLHELIFTVTPALGVNVLLVKAKALRASTDEASCV
jgi:hypothetical protein